MAMATVAPPVTQDEERATEERKRAEERRILRERQLEKALQELACRHQEERRALSQELRDLAVARKAIQDQLLAEWVSSSSPDLGLGRHDLTPEQQLKVSAKHHLDGGKERAVMELGEEEEHLKKLSREDNRRSSHQEDGASCSSPAWNGKEGPGEGDEGNPHWVKSVLKASQQDKELLKELLPAKNDVHVEIQHLLEVLEEKELRKAFEHRIKVEDPRKIERKARRRTVASRRAGMWRFVSKKKERKPIEGEGSAEDDIAYVDRQKLGPPKLPACYKEIKNLLDIEKNPVFSKVLQEWNRKEELCSRRVEGMKNRLASMQNDVFQLIGSFTVFQGVVLTTVAQSSLLYCHNKWIPITLSVLASVISTGGIMLKLYQINDLQTNIESEDRDYKTTVQVGRRLRDWESKGPDFLRLNLEIEGMTERQSKLRTRRRTPVLLFLVAFALLFPISFWRILCNPGSPPAANAQ